MIGDCRQKMEINVILEHMANLSRSHGYDVKTLGCVQYALFGEMSARMRTCLNLPTRYEVNQFIRLMHENRDGSKNG